MAKYCHNCKSELQGRSKFCRMCGTPIQLANVNLPMVAEAMPATERIAPPPANQPGPENSLGRNGTARTEPALLANFVASNGSMPIAPATHAMVGLFEQAGFALRLGAFMFDLLIFMAILLGSALLAAMLPTAGTVIQGLSFMAVLVCWVGNFVWLASRTGQTLGKRLVGIRIIAVEQHRASSKQILLRHLLGYPISLLALSLGFCWLLWDRQQQGWHDKIAGTLVVRKRLDW